MYFGTLYLSVFYYLVIYQPTVNEHREIQTRTFCSLTSTIGLLRTLVATAGVTTYFFLSLNQ